jgi:hypothetical protein
MQMQSANTGVGKEAFAHLIPFPARASRIQAGAVYLYGTETERLIHTILSQLSNFSVPSNSFA